MHIDQQRKVNNMGLKYNDIKVSDGRFKLSPSAFSMFGGNPSKWYKEQVLKQGDFRGNTNTVVGTIIHNRIEEWFNGIPSDLNKEDEYMQQFSDVGEFDVWEANNQVDSLWEVVKEQIGTWDKPTKMEQEVVFDIPDSNVTIAGTYDYLRGTTIGDYKTTSRSEKSIKISHKIQLACYIIALRANGVTVTDWEITYMVKTKTPKVIVIKEPIDEGFVKETKQEIKDMVKRLKMLSEAPELSRILFPNNRNSFI